MAQNPSSADADLAIAALPQDQSQAGGCGASTASANGPAVAGARAAQVLPTSEPAPDPPAAAVERAAPRGGDPTLDMTLPLLGGGGGSLAAGLWLLMRALIRPRRP